MINVREIHKSFGRIHAVRGVSFDIPSGQVAGLLGPNGAGKSTTIRIATGYLPADRGNVSVDGQDTLENSLQARRRIGYLPESAPLYPEMRTEEYLRFRARVFGIARNARSKAIGRAIERCWLSEVRRRRVGTLSKGYRQRVGLAAALLHDPPAVILDEPSNGLDPTQILEMRKLIRDLGREKAVLVSSHILSEVERTCDRVIVIARGKVRTDGTPEGLIAKAGGRVADLIEFRAPDADTRAAILEAMRSAIEPATGAVEYGDSSTVFRVEGGDDSLRGKLAAIVVRERGELVEVRRSLPTLERIFLDAIEREDA